MEGGVGTPHPHRGERRSGGKHRGVGKVLDMGAEALGGVKVHQHCRIQHCHLAKGVLHYRIGGRLVPPTSLLNGVDLHPSLICLNITKLC